MHDHLIPFLIIKTNVGKIKVATLPPTWNWKKIHKISRATSPQWMTAWFGQKETSIGPNQLLSKMFLIDHPGYCARLLAWITDWRFAILILHRIPKKYVAQWRNSSENCNELEDPSMQSCRNLLIINQAQAQCSRWLYGQKSPKMPVNWTHLRLWQYILRLKKLSERNLIYIQGHQLFPIKDMPTRNWTIDKISKKERIHWSFCIGEYWKE
jgi:hypothetical protein